MILFSPGPANISEKVRSAMTRPDICHRDTEFCELFRSVRGMINKVARTGSGSQTAMLGTCGSMAIESVFCSVRFGKKKILVISNGLYGERAAAIASRHGIRVDEMKLGWGVRPDIAKVGRLMGKSDYAGVYMVHHETSTGLLNPLKDVALAAKEHGKLVIVDAISSFAGEELDFERWGIDALVSTSNKCIRAVPGLSFIILSKDMARTIRRGKSDTYCLDLKKHLDFQKIDQTVFTPPVQVFYALQEALAELLEEGTDSRIRHYRDISSRLRAGLNKMGIKMALEERLMSNTMTMAKVPGRLGYRALHDRLKKTGFVIYGAQGKYADSYFRMGTVGVISKEDIDRFIITLKSLL